jgi:hypothetical protein
VGGGKAPLCSPAIKPLRFVFCPSVRPSVHDTHPNYHIYGSLSLSLSLCVCVCVWPMPRCQNESQKVRGNAQSLDPHRVNLTWPSRVMELSTQHGGVLLARVQNSSDGVIACIVVNQEFQSIFGYVQDFGDYTITHPPDLFACPPPTVCVWCCLSLSVSVSLSLSLSLSLYGRGRAPALTKPYTLSLYPTPATPYTLTLTLTP